MDSLEAQPVYDPVSHLVYACGREQVSDVWVAGQHLLKERRLTTLDGHEILNKVSLWQDRIGAANRTGHEQP
jgi:5-methylthioadenosine/S-adenosylhomocysteine deaminase